MTFFERPDRQPYQRLRPWHLRRVVREGEIVKHTLDLSAALAPESLTISGVSSEASGPTVSSLSNTTTTLSLTTVGSGWVDLTVTLSDSSTRILRLDLKGTTLDGPSDYLR